MFIRHLDTIDARHYVLYFVTFLRLLRVSSHRYDNGSYSPSFEKQLIKENIKDGYWIEAFQPDDQTPVGLIAYGLADGEINFYPNPFTTTEKIDPILVQKLISPVAIDQADITNNGFKDIIICFDYGKTITDFNPDGGHIVWLENPGHKMGAEPWKQHYVGRIATMHRLKIGHFTQTKRWEIIGMPIVNGPFDVPVSVLLFRQPDNVLNATAWDREIINNEFFHLIHDAKKFNVHLLDNLLIASREGLNWLYYNENSRKWIIEKIADGEQGEKRQTNYYGSAGVDTGKVGSDTFAYIATIEPFHGNVVAVYIKTTNNSLTRIQWQRYVLDVYGHPDQHGEGPGHYVVCADFDKDGDDEFLVALRGPSPNEGVFYYKPVDLSRGLFDKWQVSDVSAARIAVADFNNDDLLDFATISYYVLGYYTAKNPSINVFYNRLTYKKLYDKQKLQVTEQNNELFFTVPRPNKVLQYQALRFLTIGGITLSLEILPSFSSRQVDKNTYIKVLWGIITWTDSSATLSQSVNHSRTFLCEPKTVCSLEIHSDDNRIKTGSEGALFIVLEMPKGMNDISRFDSIQKVMLKNSLPEHCPEEARKLSFKFVKVDELEWGKEKFKGLEFYNMKGFNIKFADNDEQLCHIQLWAAGKGTNAGVHNHLTDRFCEVHVCIVNGNGKSGMQYLNSSKEVYDPFTTSDSEFVRLDVPAFYEQGPLWDIDAQKQPVLRKDGTVVYPWHKWQSGTSVSSNQKRTKILPTRNVIKATTNVTITAAPLPGSWPRGFHYAPASDQSYDIWMAIEYNIKLSTLPN